MATTPLCLVFVRCGEELSVVGQTLTNSDEERIEPETIARTTIERQTGLAGKDISVVRTGGSVECAYDGLDNTAVQFIGEQNLSPGTSVRLYPVLCDCQPVPESDAPPSGPDRGSPLEVLQYERTSRLWEAYDSVRPTVGHIEQDREHGSATLSIWALSVLRDEAMLNAVDGGGYSSLRATAQSLIDARPTMTVLTNRVARAVDAADSTDPRKVAHAAQDGIGRALSADSTAARNASERLDEKRIATLSRSGTVSRALRSGSPAAVLVAHSMPGGEGSDVAEELHGTVKTTLTSDAAFPGQLGEWDADVLLVGADSILGDGRVINKVGTFPAAVAAAQMNVDVLVVTATDKISPRTSFDAEHQSGELFGNVEPSVAVQNPTFEATPLSYVDAVITEDGELTSERIQQIATDHAAHRNAL